MAFVPRADPVVEMRLRWVAEAYLALQAGLVVVLWPHAVVGTVVPGTGQGFALDDVLSATYAVGLAVGLLSVVAAVLLALEWAIASSIVATVAGMLLAALFAAVGLVHFGFLGAGSLAILTCGVLGSLGAASIGRRHGAPRALTGQSPGRQVTTNCTK